MKARIEVLAGIAGSGKTTALLGVYRAALRSVLEQARPGATLWLAPTNRARAEIRERLLDGSLSAVFRPNLLTFDDFADQVLKLAPSAATQLSSAMQRVLLRRVVDGLARENRLTHFAKIAATSGFLDLVSAFISELKRSETWPEQFVAACKARGMRPRDRELGLIYTRYQESLVTGGVYDGEGRFWSAREALQNGHWGRFVDLSLVIVDGFTDFTEAQYKILELLSRKADRMMLSLLMEEPLERIDLFAKTSAVLERLEGAAESVVSPYPTGGAEEAAGESAIPPAIDHLARHLFANPREINLSRDTQGIEVVAVAGQGGEVNLLATRIKRLLLEGAAPGEIVVAVRDLDGYAGLIDETFSAAGIPFACEAGTPLGRLPPFKALLNALAMELEDWPFRRLMGLLDSALFHPDWNRVGGGRGARDVAAALRRAEIEGGRERILTSLERTAWSPTAAAISAAADSPVQPILPPPDADPSAAGEREAQSALRLLRRLSEATSELRRPHDLDGWSAVVVSLARVLGFDGVSLGDDPLQPALTFGELLASILFDAARAEAVAGIQPAPLNLGEFIAELTDLVERQRLPPRGREEGRVRVLSAEQVRNLDVPYLFLAGLTENSFPRHRSDDCLYGEGERHELNKFGLSLGDRTRRAQEELLMFYGVVSRARKQLVLTYPVVTAEGQPLSPSPYLSGLMELFDPAVFCARLEEQLDPIPCPDRIVSGADARIRGMFDALAGNPGLFRAVCEEGAQASTTANCLAAIEMNVRRFHTPGFTNFEGRLENSRNIELLGQFFSHEHEFSATQLEAYARCPFRFMLSQVLRLEPPATPGVETDFGQRGTLVHEVLAELHRELFESSEAAHARPGVPRGEDVAAMFQKLLGEKLEKQPSVSQVHDALRRIEKRLLTEWGTAYGRQWDEYVAGLPRDDSAPIPARFETAFGSPAGSDSASRQTEPLVFGKGPDAVRVGGRIDRIDVGRVGDRTVFAVIDYKTGRRARTKYDTLSSGRTLQLALYTLAVSRLEIVGREALPWQMGYWHIRETGFASDSRRSRQKEGSPLAPLDEAVWESLVQTLEDIIPRLAFGIRSGRFPVYNEDPDCAAGCPYNTVCRVAQIRALPPEMGKVSNL